MRTLLLEGFGRQIVVFLLVTIALGGAGASLLSFGIERYFHSAVSSIAGAPGDYDLIIHLRQDGGDEALRVLYDRLRHYAPDITWRRTTDLGGYVNVLVALPKSHWSQTHVDALDDVLREVPAYAGSTWVISPSVTISDVHPGLKESMLTIVRSRPEVHFVFERGDTIWAVLRSPHDVPAVEAYLNDTVRRMRVVEFFPLDLENEIDLDPVKDQVGQALAEHFPAFAVRDLGPSTSAQDEISALRTIRTWLAELATGDGDLTLMGLKPPTWWQVVVGFIQDLLAKIGLGGSTPGTPSTSRQDPAHLPDWISPETTTRLIEAIDTLLTQAPAGRGPMHFVLQGEGDIPLNKMDRIVDQIDPPIGWLVKDGGIVEPDPRTTVMMLIENARRIIVVVFATLMTAFIFFFDVSTLVSFCRRLYQDDGRPHLDITGRIAVYSGLLCAGIMTGIASLAGGSGGILSLWMIMALGFLVGAILSFFAAKISPIDEDQYVGAISLGVPEVTVLSEVILPTARPGLFYWWGRVRRQRSIYKSWSSAGPEAVK